MANITFDCVKSVPKIMLLTEYKRQLLGVQKADIYRKGEAFPKDPKMNY